jgi:hypothetical protein
MLRLVRKDSSSSACCARPLAFHKASWKKGAGWIRGVEGVRRDEWMGISH